MVIEVDLCHRQGPFELTAQFAAPAGVTALFGRSGAGKTTLVNLMAGLLRPTRGHIKVEGRLLVDEARRIFLPPHSRRIGYVFQEGRLFPHLTVRRNLLYGRWLAPHDRRVGQTEIEATIDLLGIGHLLERRPRDLSGGEKQRVAIGRALLSSPRLLLMDEPLASLDGARKAEILPYLERLCRDAQIPIVYVTHTLGEVVRLADTLVLLDAGRVTTAGPVRDLLARSELTAVTGRYEAGALIAATVREHRAETLVLDHPAGTLRLPRATLPVGSVLKLNIHARDVAVATGDVTGLSIRNRLEAIVSDINVDADGSVLLRLNVGGDLLLALITRDALADLQVHIGQRVVALIKAIALHRPETS